MMIKIKIKINEHIGIRQYFACQIFPNPDSSIFSPVKNLCHMVYILCSKVYLTMLSGIPCLATYFTLPVYPNFPAMLVYQ